MSVERSALRIRVSVLTSRGLGQPIVYVVIFTDRKEGETSFVYSQAPMGTPGDM